MLFKKRNQSLKLGGARNPTSNMNALVDVSYLNRGELVSQRKLDLVMSSRAQGSEKNKQHVRQMQTKKLNQTYLDPIQKMKQQNFNQKQQILTKRISSSVSLEEILLVKLSS